METGGIFFNRDDNRYKFCKKKNLFGIFLKSRKKYCYCFKNCMNWIIFIYRVLYWWFPRLFFQYNCLLVLSNHRLHKIFNFHHRIFKIEIFLLDNSCNNHAVIATRYFNFVANLGEEKNLTRKMWPDQWTGSLCFPNLNLLSIHKNSLF